jgi:polysaccharide biosynthesis/export protein
MFQIPNGYNLQKQIDVAEKNYTIQKNDFLNLTVYTNNGERAIDPNFELSKDNVSTNTSSRREINYFVDLNGIIHFPMIGEINLENLTIRQAEEILKKEYAKYYQEPFVVLKYTNKRVIVLGEPGGQVIPLVNDNIRLTEVLALSKAIQGNAKADNIRILRGDKVFLADLSTIDGYLKNNMIIESGDIVYVEPLRKPVIEALRDYTPFVSIIASLGTLVLIFTK